MNANNDNTFEALGVMRDHLRQYPDLPEIASVFVRHGVIDGTSVQVQVSSYGWCAVAGALAAWADTLTRITVKLWRVDGLSVHVHVYGHLASELPVDVYAGMAFRADKHGEDLVNGGRRGVSVGQLRAWATDDASGVSA